MIRGFLDLPPEPERPSSEECDKHRIIFGKLMHHIRGKHSQDANTGNLHMPMNNKNREFLDKCSNQKWNNRFIDIDKRLGHWIAIMVNDLIDDVL